MSTTLNITGTTTILQAYNAGIISTRAYNVLTANKFSTVQDVNNYILSGRELLQIKGMGAKSKSEILNMLDLSTLTRTNTFFGNAFTTTSKEEAQMFEEVVAAMPIDNERIANYFTRCYRDNAQNILSAVIDNCDEVLRYRRELTLEENIAFRRHHLDLLKAYADRLAQSDEHNDLLASVRHNVDRLEKDYEYIPDEIRVFLLPQHARDYIQAVYIKLGDKCLSTRLRNQRSRYFNNYEVILPYFNKSKESFVNLIPNKHAKRAQEILYNFCKEFKTVFQQILHMSNEEIIVAELNDNFPYLNEEQQAFVGNFVAEHQYLPYFYLLYRYFHHTKVRNEVLFNLFFGITSGQPNDERTVGQKMNLTRERVRQIARENPIEIHFPIEDIRACKAYDKLLNKVFVCDGCEELEAINKQEHIGGNFSVMAGLLCAVGLHGIVHTTRTDRSLLMLRSRMEEVELRDIFKKLDELSNRRNENDSEYDITPLCNNIPDDLKLPFIKALVKIANKRNNLTMGQDGIISLQRNRINLETEFCYILQKKGRPMHLSEILAAFRKLHPDHRLQTEKQLRPALLACTKVQAMGKRSMYALTSWDNVFFGSIKDLLVATLKASEAPMSLDDIMEKVHEVFPNTSRSSIATTMKIDSQHRFSSFAGQLYGLADRTYDIQFIDNTGIRHRKFEESLQLVKDFVAANKRLPFLDGAPEERKLHLWMRNSRAKRNKKTPEQLALIDDIINEVKAKGYPLTRRDNIFRMVCKQYCDYITTHNSHPTLESNAALYVWYAQTKNSLHAMTEMRQRQFNEVTQFIQEHGLNTDIPDID